MIRQYPFPYVPNTLLAFVDGTVQPAEETDPETGLFTLPEDPDDAEVRAYARISPDAVPAPPESGGMVVIDDPEDEYEEDEDIVDAEDDEAEEDDPDAPAPPDDPE